MSKMIGTCRLDITPPMGLFVSGYNVPRYADGVLDPLYVNTVVFEEDGRKAAIVVLDNLGIYNPRIFDGIRSLTQELGMDEESMFICCTHTHTGPAFWVGSEGRELEKELSPKYNRFVWDRICDSVRVAIGDLAPVKEISAREGKTEGLTFVRRFQLKDGTYRTWANKLRDPELLRPASQADETLRTTVITREDGREVILVNFQCHPDCVSGNKISADYPGFVRNTVEAGRPGSFCVFLDGAEGQMVYTDWMGGTTPHNGIEKARNLGEALGHHALALAARALPCEDTPLNYCRASVTVPTKLDMSKVPEAERICKLHAEGRDREFSKDRQEMNCIFAAAREMMVLARDQKYEIELPISVITFGGLALVGVCGEPFCEFGVLVREGSPYSVTNVCCQTNQAINYYPTAESYEQGGYEASNSRLKPGAMEALAQLSVDTLKKLHG